MTADHLNEPLAKHIRRDVTPLLERQTVGEALTFLRSQSLGERIVYFYVIDDDRRLVGVVPTRRLLMTDPRAPIASIMVADVISVPASATVRDASEILLRHKLLALPVLDAGRRLEGVADVTMFTGDLSTIAERRQADDVFQLIGAHVVRPATAWRGFVDRFPWLLCNVAGGLIAALIAGLYEGLLEVVIALALFIPVVLAVSESVSMQSVTLTVQSLHAARADWRFLVTAMRRELATAVLIGLACGALIGGVAWMWKGSLLVGLTLAATVTLAMTTAALLGVVLPGLLHANRRDPRIASGPIVLALTDFVTLIFYFNVAKWLLRV